MICITTEFFSFPRYDSFQREKTIFTSSMSLLHVGCIDYVNVFGDDNTDVESDDDQLLLIV